MHLLQLGGLHPVEARKQVALGEVRRAVEEP